MDNAIRALNLYKKLKHTIKTVLKLPIVEEFGSKFEYKGDFKSSLKLPIIGRLLSYY